MDRRTSCNAFWKALHHSSTYTFDYRNLAVLVWFVDAPTNHLLSPIIHRCSTTLEEWLICSMKMHSNGSSGKSIGWRL